MTTTTTPVDTINDEFAAAREHLLKAAEVAAAHLRDANTVSDKAYWIIQLEQIRQSLEQNHENWQQAFLDATTVAAPNDAESAESIDREGEAPRELQ